MSDNTDLEIIRRAYAKQIMAVLGVVDRRVETAFASVKREDYLGRGPWQMVRWGRGSMGGIAADIPALGANVPRA